MSSTSKTSDNFQGVSSDYATYTNDVDKPYPLAKPEGDVAPPEHVTAVDPPSAESFYAESGEGEDPDRPADDDKTVEAKAPAKRPAAKSPADK